MGLCPAGLYKNAEFYGEYVEFSHQVPAHLRDTLYDPQTSGGLLISLAAQATEDLLDKLHKAGIADASIIGEVMDKPIGKIIVE